jgi:penicillin-binding protein 1A
MSEDKDKKIQESRAVTSDKNNKASSYAVNKPAKKADVSSGADFEPEDEILELIKKRQGEKKSAAEVKEPEWEKKAQPEVKEPKTENKTGKKSESEIKETKAEKKTDPEVKETKAEKKSEPKATEPKAVKKDEPASDLEKELAKDFSENKSERKTVRRYGFKPYTRELQAEEITALQEAAAASQSEKTNEGAAAGVAGIIRKMAKGSGQKKRNTGASGTTRTSKVDKSASTAKKSAAGSPRTSGSKGKSQAKKAGAYSAARKSSSKAKKKSKKKSDKLWVKAIRAFVTVCIVLIVAGGLAGAGYAAHVISHAPTIHPKNLYDTLDVSTHIYDDQENLVDEIYYSENRQIVSYEQLPENLKNAFIAVEDKTFWTHKGFNFKRIIGAILERVHGGRISGTSTITQQLARNVFLPEDKSVRSIKRKIIEMYYAYEIEQELSKEEIITAYLNTIYLGYGCYGVDTAAKTYFSSDVENLTLEQCAALAALPQAPGTYALLVNEPTDVTVEYKNGVYINDASQDRRNMILNMMLQQGLITQEEKDAATKPLTEFIKPGSSSTAASTSAFKDYVIETVKKDLMNEYGIEEDQAIKIIYTKGLNIYTTMDSQAQKVITEQFKKKKNFPSTTNGKGTVESAMVVTEVGTGEVKAMVGTRNASGQMLFNRATNPRQPGSSIKPLSVYAPALQKSLEYQKEGKTFKFKDTGYDNQGDDGWGDYLTVSSKVVDERMKVNGQNWPNNITRTFSGYNTFRTAIQQSINTCAVKILAQIGIDYSMDTLKRFGITTAVDDTSQATNDMNLAALGLGAMSYGISPLEMSAAYAAFPNGGVVNTPICYTKVEDSSGRTLLEGKSQTTRVLDEGVAWIMVDVLKSVVTKGIAQDAKVDGIEVGGKTGTTDDRYDIWFNGFTPTYSIALWIGTDDNVQMDSLSDKAAKLWSNIVSRMDGAKGGKYKSMPDNVFRAWNGEYYTDGTAPPEPEPEPEEEEEDETHGWSDGESDTKEPDPNAPSPAPEGE